MLACFGHHSVDRLFDLGALEWTPVDGRRGVPGPAPGWTNDGGHLDESGRTMTPLVFVNFYNPSPLGMSPGKSR